MTFNQFLLYAITMTVLFLNTACADLSNQRQDHTLYVAEDYYIYNNYRFHVMTDLAQVVPCSQSSSVFLSPLVNTSADRFSKATAEFLKMCGAPETIVIEFSTQ